MVIPRGRRPRTIQSLCIRFVSLKAVKVTFYSRDFIGGWTYVGLVTKVHLGGKSVKIEGGINGLDTQTIHCSVRSFAIYCSNEFNFINTAPRLQLRSKRSYA